MNTQPQAQTPDLPGHRRRPWVALLLSFGATGLGHIYCGRLTRGLVLFFASFAFGPIIVTTTEGASSTLTFAAVALALGLYFAIFLFALMDSWRIARRTPAEYHCKEYNRWYLYLLFIAVALTYPANLAQSIHDHIVAAYKIPSTSMAPNILLGDRILLDKTVYSRRELQRGDVVVFPYPDDRRVQFLKRVVGLPGETIAIRKGVVYIDGEAITRPDGSEGFASEGLQGSVYTITSQWETDGDLPPTLIPHGHCFVLGDNRPKSRDSRYFGPVPLRDVLGAVTFTHWPARSWSRFGPFDAAGE